MNERPILDLNLDSKAFNEFHYLKEELVDFCKNYNLQATGSKEELTDRIIKFLETGEKTVKTHNKGKTNTPEIIKLDTKLESNLVCSEKHRKFFKEQIGDSFSFNVLFQKWLKDNAGKTYQESIQAYYQTLEFKKKKKTTIDKQFEYNIYIRDFFNDNKDKSLDDAIKCWKYKKGQKGHNKYEKEDLIVLSQ